MDNLMRERYQATLVGCALGDSLGMPVEAWKPEQIKKYFGEITWLRDPLVVLDNTGSPLTKDEFGKLKYWNKDLKKGQYTDDTILTLAIAESIAANKGVVLEDIAARQVAAYESYRRVEGTVG